MPNLFTQNYLLDTLQSRFSLPSFRELQEEIIQEVIEGRDCFVLMPTGGGKSLCYQLPSIIRDGVGVIVSPLIALMQDQVESLKKKGIKATYWNSSLSLKESKEVERQLLNNELELLFVSPEKILNPYIFNILKNIKLALFAIDESHCVSQWGHDFRPEYRQLGVLKKEFPEVPLMALTATADKNTQHDIKKSLRITSSKSFKKSFDRKNLNYFVTKKNTQSKSELLEFIEDNHSEHSGIIYCLSRKKVEEVAQWFSQHGFNCLPYHAGMTTLQREKNLKAFLTNDSVIIVATIAFGMGIDKADIRFVAHLDLPKSIEAYYQETGRAGRDGLPANTWMAYSKQEMVIYRKFARALGPKQKQLENYKLEQLLAFCETTTCRRKSLLNYFDENFPDYCGNCDNCQQIDNSKTKQKSIIGQEYALQILKFVYTPDHSHIEAEALLCLLSENKGLSLKGWEFVLRQMILQKYLRYEPVKGLVEILPRSLYLLKDKETFYLSEDPKKIKTYKKASSKKKKLKTKTRTAQKKKKAKVAKNVSKPRGLNTSMNRSELFSILKEMRNNISKNKNIPHYKVFQDSTLYEMVDVKPQTLKDFRELKGVGPYKVRAYGKKFLDVISDYC